MNSWILATTAGGVLVALAGGLTATAQAAPSGTGSAQAAVDELEKGGYKVVLNKLGTGPLDRCAVDSVRPGAKVMRPVATVAILAEEIVSQTVFLTAKC
jgi:hypothetical protein